MTQMDLFQTATSSQQDTHASLSALPGSAEAQKMTDISGRTYYPLFKEKDPLGAFSKMFMGMSLWASTKCYLTWKGKATPQGRSLFQLVPQTHLTDETEFGSSLEMWATPNTMDHLPQRSKEALKKQATTTRKGRSRPANLREQVNPETVEAWKEAQEPTMWATPTASQRGSRAKDLVKSNSTVERRSSGQKRGIDLQTQAKMWPTPTVQDSNKATKKWRENHQNNLTAAVFNPEMMWPTPSASNAKGAVQDRFYGSEKYRHNLDEAVRTHKYDGQLNPQWVEWLMGYPEGWTDLED
tara:strand:- start:541 stop:1431 length:891 start_codon:yes stop_codon:yes gene_type:complete